METDNSSKMIYRFALVDFLKDKALHICDISELKHDDMSKLSQENLPKWNKLEEVFLLWRSSPAAEPKRCPCHIIQICVELEPLIKTRQKVLRRSVSLSRVPLIPSDPEEEGSTERMKRSSDDQGETSYMEPVSSEPTENKESETEVERLRKQLKDLQEDLKQERNYRLKAEKELKEWKEMHDVVKDLKSAVGEWKSTVQGPETSPHQDANKDVSPTEQDQDWIIIEKEIKLRKSRYNGIKSTDYRKFTCELLTAVFGREVLATHSLHGRKSANSTHETKDALPAREIAALIEHVKTKFGVQDGEVKAVIRSKLNNEDKLWRKRLLSQRIISGTGIRPSSMVWPRLSMVGYSQRCTQPKTSPPIEEQDS